jgi:hypothetical protein
MLLFLQQLTIDKQWHVGFANIVKEVSMYDEFIASVAIVSSNEREQG